MSITKPIYYQAGDLDCIAYCMHHDLDFCTSNMIKYLTRRGKKDKSKEVEDINKAQEYLDRLKQEVLDKQEALIQP